MTTAKKLENSDVAEIGEKFKQLRAFLDLTREDLAEMTGVPLGTLRGIERGLHLPGFNVIDKIANHAQLGQYVLWLLQDEASEEPVAYHSSQLDRPLLVSVSEAVEEALKKKRKKLPIVQKAELIGYLYDQICQNKDKQKTVDMANVIQLVDFAFGMKK